MNLSAVLNKNLLNSSQAKLTDLKVLVITIFVTSLIMIFYIIYSFKTDIHHIAISLIITLFMNVVSLLILKYSNSRHSKSIAGNIFTFSMLILFLTTYVISFTGMTPAIIWFAVFPLISVLSTNLRTGLIWSLVFSLFGVILTILMTKNHFNLGIYTSKNVFIGSLMNIVLAPITVYLFTRNNNKARDNAIQKLNTSLRENKDLLNIVSHDIANPLQLIQLTAAQIKSNKNDSTEVDKILNACKIMIEVTADVKKRSRIRELNQPYYLEKTSLFQIISKINNLFQPLMRNKNITFSTPNLVEDIFIYSDSKILFNNIIQNIIGNAIKFTPRHGEIKISISKQIDSYLLMTISNSGDQITQEKIDQILVSESIETTIGTEGEVGTGLGLNIVKERLSEIGGEMDIKADQETKFILRLPLYNKSH